MTSEPHQLDDMSAGARYASKRRPSSMKRHYLRDATVWATVLVLAHLFAPRAESQDDAVREALRAVPLPPASRRDTPALSEDFWTTTTTRPQRTCDEAAARYLTRNRLTICHMGHTVQPRLEAGVIEIMWTE